MKNRILKLSSFLFATVALSSCLKDKGFDDNLRQSLRYADQKVVSIALRTDVNEQESIVSVQASAATTTINLVPVTLAGGIPATQDVHVVLDTMNSLVDQSVYAIPPNSDFTIVNKTVTIPAGQTTGYVQIQLIPNNFIGQPYALGFKIVSVDGGYTIAGNGRGQGIAEFAIANEFEADYTDVGIRYNYSAAAPVYNVGDPIPGGYVSTTPMPSPKHLNTLDATHNSLDFANLGGNGWQYIFDFGAVGAANQDYPLGITLNAAALANNSNISYKLATYNPVTKTIKLIVLYNNAPGGTGNWRLLFETLTKI